MPPTSTKSFSIGQAPGSVSVTNGTATVTCTVTNTATRALDGTVVLKPTAPAAPEWLAVTGESTRRYEPGGVEQVAVTITVPPATPAGSFSFRLDAYAEANPEEDYTEGPQVPFTVPEAAKPIPWWRKYWWIIAIAVVVILGVVAAIALGNRGSDVPERNCQTYDPKSVHVDGTAGTQVIAADSGQLASAANEQDANQAVKLAKAHTKHCAIGTGPRAVEYWLGDGGGPRPPRRDCIGYDPKKVEIKEQPGGGFTLVDGNSSMEAVTTRQDADDLLALAKAFSNQCFIGRDNVGPDRRDRLIEYWE